MSIPKSLAVINTHYYSGCNTASMHRWGPNIDQHRVFDTALKDTGRTCQTTNRQGPELRELGDDNSLTVLPLHSHNVFLICMQIWEVFAESGFSYNYGGSEEHKDILTASKQLKRNCSRSRWASCLPALQRTESRNQLVQRAQLVTTKPKQWQLQQ